MTYTIDHGLFTEAASTLNLIVSGYERSLQSKVEQTIAVAAYAEKIPIAFLGIGTVAWYHYWLGRYMGTTEGKKLPVNEVVPTKALREELGRMPSEAQASGSSKKCAWASGE